MGVGEEQKKNFCASPWFVSVRHLNGTSLTELLNVTIP